MRPSARTSPPCSAALVSSGTFVQLSPWSVERYRLPRMPKASSVPLEVARPPKKEPS
ncbi:hypothetical protein D3C86_2229100 [compost metagenome]